MADKITDLILRLVFSVPSLVLHILFFAAQLGFRISVNVVTNVISWEAIFLALLIGIQQIRHHEINQGKK